MGRWGEGVPHGSHSSETPCSKAKGEDGNGMAKVMSKDRVDLCRPYNRSRGEKTCSHVLLNTQIDHELHRL